MLALAALVTSYYSAVILIYYRTEIDSILNRKKEVSANLESPTQNEILGVVSEDINQTSHSTDELRFSSEDSNQLNEENH